MMLLDDDEEFWRDEFDEPAKAPSTTAGQDAAVRQKPPPGRETRAPGREVRAPDVNLDKFLAGMPGLGGILPESEMLDEMLVSILHTNTLRLPLGTETNFQPWEILRATKSSASPGFTTKHY